MKYLTTIILKELLALYLKTEISNTYQGRQYTLKIHIGILKRYNVKVLMNCTLVNRYNDVYKIPKDL